MIIFWIENETFYYRNNFVEVLIAGDGDIRRVADTHRRRRRIWRGEPVLWATA